MKTSPVWRTEDERYWKWRKEEKYWTEQWHRTLKWKKKKTSKIPDLHLIASSNQWKTLTQKNETLQVGSAQEPFPHADKGSANTHKPKSILVAALQLDSKGDGWKAGRKGNNGCNPIKLFIGEWQNALFLFYSTVYFIQWKSFKAFF